LEPEVNISYDTLENNIEGGNLHNTIISMIAERASLDVAFKVSAVVIDNM
jgi:hypothetical protein